MPSTEDQTEFLDISWTDTWFFRPSHNPLRRDWYEMQSAGGAKLWRRDQSGRSKCTVLQSDRQTKFSSLALGKISQESYVSAK